MRNIKNVGLSDRRSTAADAKASLLQAYRAAREAAEPTREARQADRLAIADARQARQAERAQIKLDEQLRIDAEAAERKIAIAAAARAEVEALEAADKNRVTLALEDAAARKAERDRRYANRKARQA